MLRAAGERKAYDERTKAGKALHRERKQSALSFAAWAGIDKRASQRGEGAVPSPVFLAWCLPRIRDLNWIKDAEIGLNRPGGVLLSEIQWPTS